MTLLQTLPVSLQKSIQHRSLLKVISGLSNFNPESVFRISKAAGLGGADLLDIACEPELVELAVEASNLPVCVSSVEPKLFPEAVKAGASIIEIGNFDSFYPDGRFFSAEEVLSLAVESRRLLPEVVLSVTVPHVLPLDSQAQLALDLVDKGVDLVQTEGGTSSHPISPGTLGLIEKASPTLAATFAITAALNSNHSDVPVICASGLSEVTVPMAISVGASGVGIGSAVNKLNSQLAMIATVKSLRQALNSFEFASTINK
ncbi:DUF561 domain-containing protein [Prochlorococcus marinus]|uniref:DUF561 domain-containing protein n=1 Tax=Prochlorococcus marinus XMU1408 TaxID=2213228 RepID=A0A318QV29_PROMR|nr:DUF561 domain-containing protein [Prochlorococcus marinus]MBW3042899.1 DUF561 domain-containing protein [Prochlorococcus marinus str. XMU1408]PYE00256.1 DUF561 domain-containing protein [Prochlorococcus marinus XMU1408]